MCDHFFGTLGFDQVFLTLKSFVCACVCVCVCVYKKSRWWDLGVPKGIPAHRPSPVTQWFLKFTHSLLLELKYWICCSVSKSCLTVFDPMDCSMPGFPAHHHLPEFSQIHVHRVSDAIQPSHPLSSPSFPAFNLSQHQGLFQWVSSLHQVAKVLELQHQSFQWIFRNDFL